MKRAFTLIELIVTMAIIAVMALVAVPSFTKYEENATFNAKVAEIVSAISQTAVSAQNPEQNVLYYAIETDTTNKEIRIYKDATLEKTITTPSIVSTITMATNGSPTVPAVLALKFNAGKNFACNQADKTSQCVEASSFNGNYIIINRTSGTSKTINVKSNPVRATSQ